MLSSRHHVCAASQPIYNILYNIRYTYFVNTYNNKIGSCIVIIVKYSILNKSNSQLK